MVAPAVVDRAAGVRPADELQLPLGARDGRAANLHGNFVNGGAALHSHLRFRAAAVVSPGAGRVRNDGDDGATTQNRQEYGDSVVPIVAPHVGTYFEVVASDARRSRDPVAAPELKLSAAQTETALLQTNHFSPKSRLHCERAARNWDYVCSYLPTPTQSQTTLQFGVAVNATRWVSVSRVVPVGTVVPPPE